MRYFTLLPLAFLLPLAVFSSSGDRSPEFISCVDQCEQDKCKTSADSITLSLALRLTRWTCADDCKYSCMHSITDEAILSHEKIHQYYGKWPFWRLAGVQEPASVLFSILNLMGHVQGFNKASRLIPKSHPMRPYYLGWGIVNINAWIWSVVFHTRGKRIVSWLFKLFCGSYGVLIRFAVFLLDLPITEKLDYFSAGLAIVYSLYYTVIRLFHLYPASTSPSRSVKSTKSQKHFIWTIWTTFCVTIYTIHILYLSISPRFDYSYNMAANLVLGIVHNLLWTTYAGPFWTRPFPYKPRGYKPEFAYKAGLFAILTFAATALELFDFPPWNRIIDAHALWHLSTSPIVLLWWSFLINDALDEGWRFEKL